MKPMATLDEDRSADDELEYSSKGWRLVLISAGVAWLLVIGVFCGVAHADTDLAVTCEPVNGLPASGTARKLSNVDTCPKVTYRRPTPATLVLRMASDTWTAFGALAATDTAQICKTNVTAGSVSNPSNGLPCTQWAEAAASAIIVAAPPNGSGTISLDWDPTLTCIDYVHGNVEVICSTAEDPRELIAGYRIFSGVSPASISLIKTVSPTVTTLQLPGYGNGTYYFAVQAFNGDPLHPDSPMSSIVSVEVNRPVEAHGTTPKSVSGVRITVTYE